MESIEQKILTDQEKKDIEVVFQGAEDFRSVGKKITEPLDEIMAQTHAIVSKDPILNVSEELADMNQDIQSVYDDIIDRDGAVMSFFKSIPLIGILAKSLDQRFDRLAFNTKDVNQKIEHIFGGFDQAYKSLNVSTDVQKTFLSGLEIHLGKIMNYKSFLEERQTEFVSRMELATDEVEAQKMKLFSQNVDFFVTNLAVLIGNLEMAQKRIIVRLDSAQKLSLAMDASRPIFQTLLSAAVIEVSGQKAVEASSQAIQSMGKAIDKISSDLTDKVIESNKSAEKIVTNPVLSSTVFVENVTRLRTHFNEIEKYRAAVAVEKTKEMEAFNAARKNLTEIQVMNQADKAEFDREIELKKLNSFFLERFEECKK